MFSCHRVWSIRGDAGRAAPVFVALTAAIGFGALALAPQPALADCFLNGSTVTCSAPGTGGYSGPTVDGVTLTVQPDATVDGAGATAIDLNDNNTVTNRGTVRVGDGALGINVNNSNTVTNAGNIIFGDSSTGINGCCDNVVINSGTITGGTGGYGIYVTFSSTVTNSGSITVGSGSYGILAYGNGTGLTITNNGTITAPGGFGIGALTGYNIVNNGTIDVGTNGTGIQVDGGSTVTNAGTIRGNGTTSFGLYLDGFGSVAPGSTVVNSGSILMSAGGYAVLGDSDNTITNTGTMQGQIFLPGFGNTVTNRGYMINGDPSNFTTPGVSQIGGTLINDPSGTIAIRVAPTFNDYYIADTVTLNGGRLRMVVTPGLYGTTTTYSNAGSFYAPVQSCNCTPINGTFDTVTASSPFFTATADYSTTGAVNVTLTRLGFGAVPGMTPNQRAVGGALEPGYSPSLDPTSTIGQFYANLLAASSMTVLDQLSGQGTSAAQDASFSAGAQFSNAMFQQALSWLTGSGGAANSVVTGGATGYAADTRSRIAGHDAFAAMTPRAAEPGRWRAWALGFGGTRSADGETSTGSTSQTTHTYGGAFGVDRQLADDLLIGVAAGGTGSNFSAPGLSTSGTVDGGHVGLYAIKTFGPTYLAATLNYARLTNKTERTIAGVGPTENATGRFDSDQLGGRLELGRRYRVERYTLTPFVAIEPAVLWQKGYTENSTVIGGGGGVLGLSYAANTVTSLPLFVGAQIDSRWTLSNGATLSPSLRAAWVHEFKPNRAIEASFISIPSPSFTVDGARAARDALRVEAGATLALNRSMALFARFDGEVASGSRMASATGGATLTW